MNKIRYADAGMDLRKLMLSFLRRSWIVLLAAAAGAAAGALIYLGLHTVREGQREYRAVSKLYLDFAADETGQVYQEYNGYTWNDLMRTDPILDVIMEELGASYDRKEAAEAIKAEILSDLRLLTITVTTKSPEETDAILRAADHSLEQLGQGAKEFTQIRTIQEDTAALVVADSRLTQAVCLGAAGAFAAAVLVLLFCYILDDRIVTPTDLRAVTELPFAGYLEICGEEGASFAAERLREDCESNLAYLKAKHGELRLIEADPRRRLGEQELAELRGAEGLVICVPYGKVHAVFLALFLEQLSVRECSAAAVVITGAESRFLGAYYGMRKGRKL